MENIDFRITEISRIIERSNSIGWHMENTCYDEYYAVVYILNGETEYHVDKKKYIVRKDDIIIFPPKAIRSGKTSPEHPWSFINILFRMETNESSDRYFNKSVLIFKNADDTIRRQFIDASSSWISKNPLYQIKCNYLATEILYKIILSEMPYHKVPHIKKLEKARKTIQDNFRSNVSVEELAAAAGLSVSYFRRLFRKAYGTSPMQYIMDLRIETARDLLLSGEANVTEAARLSGFDDVYYFSTLFKRKTGNTPSQLLRKG